MLPSTSVCIHMARAETKYFGPQEYAEDAVIRIPGGIPGFQDESEFILIQFPDQFPLVYLQSTRRPDVCFAALPVRVLDRLYELELTDDDAELLDVPVRPTVGGDVLCLSVLVSGETGAFANLFAPIVINMTTRVAAQCVNSAGSYSCEHAIEEVAAA